MVLLYPIIYENAILRLSNFPRSGAEESRIRQEEEMIKKKANKGKTTVPSDPAEPVLHKSGQSFSFETPGGGNGNPDPIVSKRERIALLAYSYWVQRGRQGGSPEEDWFRAEREITLASSK